MEVVGTEVKKGSAVTNVEVLILMDKISITTMSKELNFNEEERHGVNFPSTPSSTRLENRRRSDGHKNDRGSAPLLELQLSSLIECYYDLFCA